MGQASHCLCLCVWFSLLLISSLLQYTCEYECQYVLPLLSTPPSPFCPPPLLPPCSSHPSPFPHTPLLTPSLTPHPPSLLTLSHSSHPLSLLTPSLTPHPPSLLTPSLTPHTLPHSSHPPSLSYIQHFTLEFSRDRKSMSAYCTPVSDSGGPRMYVKVSPTPSQGCMA